MGEETNSQEGSADVVTDIVKMEVQVLVQKQTVKTEVQML